MYQILQKNDILSKIIDKNLLNNSVPSLMPCRLVDSLPQFWRNVIGCLTLKMETLISSETSLTFYQWAQRNMPEDLMLQSTAAV